MKTKKSIEHWYIRIILITIILIGGFLRFYNSNWDEGHMFHPDERNIANAVTRISVWDQMDPGFFAYGGLTIYLYKMTADNVVQITDNPEWTSNWGKVNLIGRYYSAFFSTITIIAVFVLARKLFDEKVAILASFLFAFTVFSIQSAHYATTESLLGLFATLIALSSLWILRKPTLASYLITGLLLGCAIAAKTTSLAFVAFPAAAIFFSILQRKIPFMAHVALSIILFSTALSLFSVLSPYSFLSWEKFRDSMDYEGGVVSGSLPVPYTLQFTNTLEYVFQLQNLLWQMGIAAVFAILGFFALSYRLIRRREVAIAVLLSFPLAYFLYVGGWHAKFIRYMAPLLPFFAIFAAYMLWKIYKKNVLIGEIIITAVSLLTVLWTLAFFTIYTKPQTRIVASEWIYANVSPGNKILTEHWDDGLPIGLDTQNPSIYTMESLEIYQPDDEAKRAYYADKLSTADYIVINSRRLYGTLLYLPEKYPLTKKYYELLFAEKLGYKKVAEFTSYPSLLGYEINDDYSEETFQVYEHPKVLVFQNVERHTRNVLWEVLR
jgi:4-amino-4-deoxy-L-arabinose transferase-like glycosyltransferase